MHRSSASEEGKDSAVKEHEMPEFRLLISDSIIRSIGGLKSAI
jgi:hypothetical protein